MDCLDESIKHWERVLEFVKNEDLPGLREEGWAGKSCACCRDFLTNFDECDGCPIMEYTGEQDCVSTPWWKANVALYAMVDDLIDTTKDTIEAVTEELDFLKKVRDA